MIEVELGYDCADLLKTYGHHSPPDECKVNPWMLVRENNICYSLEEYYYNDDFKLSSYEKLYVINLSDRQNPPRKVTYDDEYGHFKGFNSRIDDLVDEGKFWRPFIQSTDRWDVYHKFLKGILNCNSRCTYRYYAHNGVGTIIHADPYYHPSNIFSINGAASNFEDVVNTLERFFPPTFGISLPKDWIYKPFDGDPWETLARYACENYVEPGSSNLSNHHPIKDDEDELPFF